MTDKFPIGLRLPTIPEPEPTEPNIKRSCGRRSAHDPHPYSYIDLRGRNIGFGQTFDCPGKAAPRRMTERDRQDSQRNT